MLALEFGDEVVDHAIVKVLSTQMGIAGCGLDFEDTVFNRQNGHIESATAQVENEDVALAGSLKK